MSLIVVEDLTKTYNTEEVEVHALRGVDFTIDEGSFVSFVGSSGSGKTTLAQFDRLSGQTHGWPSPGPWLPAPNWYWPIRPRAEILRRNRGSGPYLKATEIQSPTK